MHTDHGVLAVRILDRSLMNPAVLDEITDRICDSLHRADTAVVIDCSELTYNVTSQFLGRLVALRREALARGVDFCVCGVRGALREAFEIVQFDRLIPCFDTSDEVVEALGQFTDRERTVRELEKAKRETIAQYRARDAARQAAASCESRSTGGRLSAEGSKRDFNQSNRSAAIAVSAGVALILIALALLAVVGRWAFSEDQSVAVPAARARLPNLGSYSATELAGTITCQSRGVVSPDRGARIVAWPAGLKPEPKFSAAEALADNPHPRLLPDAGLYRGRTGKDGKYSIRIHTLGEFFVLIISDTTSRTRAIADYDLAVLSTCFQDPRELIGDRAHCLTRCSVASNRPVIVDWQFGADAPY
jgi:anti-anti-sigma regulatory factor